MTTESHIKTINSIHLENKEKITIEIYLNN